VAQIEGFAEYRHYKQEIDVLPKSPDEKVARLHLAEIGVKLTTLRPDQADDIGVKVEGPFKSDPSRY
jgi:adenosylhomocysteinase